MENTKANRFKFTEDGVKAFLKSSAVEGIGKVYADRLVDKYGTNVIQMLLEAPTSVKDVRGVGETRLLEASESLKQYRYSPDITLMLYSAGVPELFVDRIFGKYRKMAAEIIITDPYSMVEDVWRLSFFTADKIGTYLGIKKDDSRRLRGAVVTAIKAFCR